MIRKYLSRLLSIAGVALLAYAALLAWNIYNPAANTPPADATVVTAMLPPDQLPPHSHVAQSTPSVGAPAPQVLPETKPTTQTPTEKASEEATNLSERKINYAALAEARAKAFPPPAHSAPSRIVLPTISVDSPVVQVGWKTFEQNGQLTSEWEVADYAVGFHQNSALPGAVGNTVMTGHNNIKGEVFKNLIELKISDEVFVFADDKPYRYRVTQKLLVKEKDAPMELRLQNAQWIAPTDDMRLTLVSCWPYSNNTHRVIIVAKPAE